MLRQLSAAVLLLAFAVPESGYAVADKPSSRFCKPQDLVGTWRVVKWTSEFQFKDPNAPYLLPHQLFHFSADGSMKSAHSAKPFDGDQKKMFQATSAVVTYSFNQDGMVTIKAKSSPGASETWHCVSMTQDRADDRQNAFLKRGDIVMTLVGKNGQPLYARQMRK
ncbi:MAG: hypothetical protein E6K69_04250 [Nitrospirae bacterium]|nr:MAG: hypothetical protein E6K69_04250 [Nitrospirota bacterium]